MTATREIHSVPTTKRSTGVGGWARMIPLILGDEARSHMFKHLAANAA